ncbi:rod shape-determining protein MreD [Lipingzhangella sp. LS1_29]|uniref:Rod shape-determining protein MreD n=1 Tax=Lipingzhangella rawalii TaxID=2055835 RepID=A0ABU2H744_9ACTN|nr:rod shape-determining protein MreD [Lipingzhangella rawalii]MDS1271118.1 rod shape-determining protein MreD [Lipingzhangella rawalii]
MSGRIVAVVLLAGAVLVQVTILNRIPLPWGVAPDLVLVVLVGVALRLGAVCGAVGGFCSGLALDVLPPTETELGRYAVLLCLAGYLAGSLAGTDRDSPVLPFALTALAALGVGLGFTGIGLVLGESRASLAGIVQFLPVTVGYTLLISPFALFVVSRCLRRFAAQRDPLWQEGEFSLRGDRAW